MHTTAPPLELQAIGKLREEELEEARSLQSVMLPAESLRAGKVSISHAFQPMAEVGGDFLDYFELTDGCVGLYVGDVSGKGLPAAMYAALAVGTLRGVHKTGQSPGDVLSTLNRRLLIRGTPRPTPPCNMPSSIPTAARCRLPAPACRAPSTSPREAAEPSKSRGSRRVCSPAQSPTKLARPFSSRATRYSS
jgi:stage II sporulation SpoE-like protein